MKNITPQLTERNKAIAADYKHYQNLRAINTVDSVFEAADYMKELEKKYGITDNRIRQIGSNPKYQI
jgi:hypothetical protein